jgi:hypothetical protein
MIDFQPPEDSQDSRPIQPMQPPPRSTSTRASSRRGAYRDPIQPTLSDEFSEESEFMTLDAYEPARPRAAHREVDPLVTYLVIIALSIGISPLGAIMRYTLLWTLMSVLGAVAYLLGGVERMREAKLDDLFWGVIFGFFTSFPFLIVFGTALKTVSIRMFDVDGTPSTVMDTWVFMATAFVVPFCETLYFRGGMQGVRSILLTSLLATLWSAVLFFPHMELGGRAVIGAILLIVFSLLNFMYSYVQFRNGLAAAWLCQVLSYTLLWFFPRVFF